MSAREVLPDEVASRLLLVPHVRVWDAPRGLTIRGNLAHVCEALVVIGHAYARTPDADLVGLALAMHDVSVTVEGRDWAFVFGDLMLTTPKTERKES